MTFSSWVNPNTGDMFSMLLSFLASSSPKGRQGWMEHVGHHGSTQPGEALVWMPDPAYAQRVREDWACGVGDDWTKNLLQLPGSDFNDFGKIPPQSYLLRSYDWSPFVGA